MSLTLNKYIHFKYYIYVKTIFDINIAIKLYSWKVFHQALQNQSFDTQEIKENFEFIIKVIHLQIYSFFCTV